MRIILFLILAAAFCSAEARQEYGDIRINEVISIYDGDSFFVEIDGWPEIIGKRIGIRVSGIDTPEIRGAKCQKEKILARAAKQFTVSALRSGKVIFLKKMRRGKYFRIISDVEIDGQVLSEMLINAGVAVEYHGGTKKKDWCL